MVVQVYCVWQVSCQNYLDGGIFGVQVIVLCKGFEDIVYKYLCEVYLLIWGYVEYGFDNCNCLIFLECLVLKGMDLVLNVVVQLFCKMIEEGLIIYFGFDGIIEIYF